MTGVTDRDPPLSRLAGLKSVALAVTCSVTDVTLLSRERERERVSDRKGVMERKRRQVGERETRRN